MLPPPGLEPSSTLPTLLQTLLSTSGLALATSTPYSDSFHAPSPSTQPDSPKNGECELLGPFALIVQLALGGLALLALVFKRWRERPQRPVKVWAFDVSKQVVGSVLLHAANLLMSMLSSGQFSMKTVEDVVVEEEEPNPCSFYFLNLLIDTTLGIPILIYLLHLLTRLFLLSPLGVPPQSIESGHYGSPPKAQWWAKQSLIYFLGLVGMKTVVLLIFIFLPWISHVGDWALRWTEGNEKLQVFFVMLFFPVVMNATQYYIIDTFIKGKIDSVEGGRGALGAESDSDSDGERDEGEGLLGDEAVVVKHKTRNPKAGDSAEYDEARDGANVGSSEGSGTAAVRAKSLEESEDGDESPWRGEGRGTS